MPQPLKSDIHVNVPLSNMSLAYIQKDTDFVSGKMFPNIPVVQQSGKYFQYAKGQWFRSDAQERGLSQESAGTGYAVDSTPEYACKVDAVHKDIDDQLRSNADAPINLDREATMLVTQQLLIRREKKWASAYFQTGVWNGAADFSPTTKWNASGSTPIVELRDKIKKIRLATGFMPNKLLLSEDVWFALKDNADFLDKIRTTNDKIVTKDLLARILDIDEVLVAGAIENTAKEGATPVMSYIFTKGALLVHAAPNPGIMVPSAGYTFSWSGYLGSSAYGTRISRMRADLIKSDRIEGEMASDHKVVGADLGAFIYDAIS